MIKIDVMTNQLDYELGNQGKVKPVNGVNGLPISIAPGLPELQHQFNEMKITDIRLHDSFGPLDIDNYYPYGRTAEQLLPNVPANEKEKAGKLIADLGNLRTIFPNAALGMRRNSLAIALKDANWDIADNYLRKIVNNEIDNPNSNQRNVIFRIGRSIDGGFMMPENIDIYSSLVANIVDRYTNNFSKIGLKRKVSHWEIWNEPNLSIFWSESNRNYCIFYGKIASAIKKIDIDAKVGGPGLLLASIINNPFLENFLMHCRENKLPLDFLSWHLYSVPNPDYFISASGFVKSLLIKYGFGHIESILGEWNSSPVANINCFSKVQSAVNASYIASVLIKMQSSSIDRAHYYRGDGASFGLFNLAYNPKKPTERAYCSYSAQAFKLFSEMLDTPNILRCSNVSATGVSVLCAKNDRRINILIANYKNNEDLHDADKEPVNGFYEQYHIDSSKTLSELSDELSKETWFGGKDPRILYSNNKIDEIPKEFELDMHMPETYKYYNDSSEGIILNIFGIDKKITKTNIFRIYEGGDLSSLQPEEIDITGIISQNEGTVVIEDRNAVDYTVTLYSIETE